MQKILFPNEFFNIKDTLECGQLFRFVPYKKGYAVHTLDKRAYLYEDGYDSVIECNDCDVDYFYRYFDLARDYSEIYRSALGESVDVLSQAANLGKGIRILNQDKTEALFSFIVSQNNNIPRIKGIIEKLCSSLGDKKVFGNETYYSFPAPEKMARADVDFYKSIGLGYRAEYIRRLAVDITDGFNINSLTDLPTKSLKARLTELYGVGVKVADCVSLFGFHRADAFPVDTWTEKVYLQDFGGVLKDRAKIADWFVQKFGDNSGYYQQYLFYYKRIKENKG